VKVLGSAATRPAATRAGFDVLPYRRSPDPDTAVAFERQVEEMMFTAAGLDLALDVREVLAEEHPELAIVDCMLPAATAAAEAAGAPAASLVHFLYGFARDQMRRSGGGWTTDLTTLKRTRAALDLPSLHSGIATWETPELVLVTAPRWLDLASDYPAHVVHAGPLGVKRRPSTAAFGERPRVLLSFSTTVIEGQIEAMQRALRGVAGTGVSATLTLGPAVDAAAVAAADEVEVVAYADHDRLLADSAAVVTHGGLGTTLRALAHGVPLLLLPLGRDQDLNAGRVASIGAGIRLERDATPADVGAALDALLVEPSFAAAARESAARIAADEPDRRATDALEAAFSHPPS
jgi:hypothetical protein